MVLNVKDIKELPRYVLMGEHTDSHLAALRLNIEGESRRKRNHYVIQYWCDGGSWGTEITRKKDGTYRSNNIYGREHKQLHDVLLTPCSFEEYQRVSTQYTQINKDECPLDAYLKEVEEDNKPKMCF